MTGSERGHRREKQEEAAFELGSKGWVGGGEVAKEEIARAKHGDLNTAQELGL